jgi:serine/threonine-protein kinase
MPDAAPRHYRFEGYRLDTQTRELRDGRGAVVALTAKAFDTLCFLIENRQRVVGKEALFAAVWPGRVVEDNNLTQAIATLRRALGTDGSDHRFIVTVPGRGYRFVAGVEEDDGAQGEAGNLAPAATASSMAPPAAATETDTPAPPPATIWRQPITVGALLFLLALFAVIAWRMRDASAPAPDSRATAPASQASAAPAHRTALAVLPFRSLSSGPGDEGLELGLADTLITRLSRSSALQVRALSSAQRLAGTTQEAKAAGRELGAAYVVEGTTQRAVDRIRVNARLLSVADGRVLWAETFDEHVDSVFTLQDRIGDAVTSALSLAPVVVPVGSESPCDGADAAAYRAYLSGQNELGRPSALRTRQSLVAFRRAIDLDPTCARAYAGMANAYRLLAMVADSDPGEVFPLAQAMADKALALDPALAEAHVALGWIRLWHDWDWPASEASFRRAIELNPSLSNAHFGYANLLKHTGRDAEAAQAARQALALDPLSPVINAIGGWFVPDPRQALDRSLQLDPDYWLALLLRGVGRVAAGDLAAGVADLEQARRICGDCSHALITLGVVKARTGDADGARAILRGMEARDREGYWPASSLATLRNALGETDAALDLLERAYRERDVRMSFLVIDLGPRWNNLRRQPRFLALMRQMKFAMPAGGATPAIKTHRPASANTSAAGRSNRS